MYTYVSSLVLPNTPGAQWATADLSEMSLSSIYGLHTRAYITVHNSVTDEDVYCDLIAYRSRYSNYTSSLEHWLEFEIAGNTLETVASLPNSQIRYTKYSDMSVHGYQLDFAIMGQPMPNHYLLAKPDLLVTRPTMASALELMHTHALISVNGYVHRTHYSPGKLFIEEGGKSAQRANMNHCGILSFADIGRLWCIPIDTDSVEEGQAGLGLYPKLYFEVQLPSGLTDLANKSVILSLGGYLVFVQANRFWQVSDTTFALSLSNLQYPQKLFESSHFLDLSSLGLTVDNTRPGVYSVQEMISDQTVLKYLQLSQSFLIVVDTPMLETSVRVLNHPRWPGLYTTQPEPTSPLFVGHGRMAEYLKFREDNVWALRVADNFRRGYLALRMPLPETGVVSQVLDPTSPVDGLRGHLLEIRSYT